jgi:hypothetical protein
MSLTAPVPKRSYGFLPPQIHSSRLPQPIHMIMRKTYIPTPYAHFFWRRGLLAHKLLLCHWSLNVAHSTCSNTELQHPSTTDTFFTASVTHSHDHEIISDTYAIPPFFGQRGVVAHKLLLCRLLGSSGLAPSSSLLLRGVEHLNVLFILK